MRIIFNKFRWNYHCFLSCWDVLKTVAQVIQELSHLPQDMRVLVSDQAGRLTDFDDAEVVSFPKGDFPPLDAEEMELDGVYVVIHQKSQTHAGNLSVR